MPAHDDRSFIRPKVFAVRVLAGAVQGLALYALIDAVQSLQSAHAVTFIPLLLVASFIPLLFIFGVGEIRPIPLLLWITAATAVVAALGAYDVLRGFPSQHNGLPALWLSLAVALFIAHVLVVDSVAERRLVADYERHFDTAWKIGVQTVLAVLFVGLFWGILFLGSNLFQLLGLDFLQRLLQQKPFIWLATTIAFAIFVHIADVQVSLIRGARSVVLALLSWLLPLFALIILGFLGSLLVVPLQALWNTRLATPLLLSAAAVLVFLINASYPDIGEASTAAKAKRIAIIVACVELLPLAWLAAWALGLRVMQYGWTTERIFAAAFVAIASFYAVGYAWALVGMPAWRSRFEMANVAAAYLILALFLALFSPIADPARLMVADQVARLKSGAVAVNDFDFRALKFEGARWGQQALEGLSQTKSIADFDEVNSKAKDALKSDVWASPSQLTARAPQTIVPADYVNHVTVYPAGSSLPAEFFDRATGPFSETKDLPLCLRYARNRACSARLVALHEGGPEAIVLFDVYSAFVFEKDGEGRWREAGTLLGRTNCAAVRDGFEKGDMKLEPHRDADIIVGDQRLTIRSYSDSPCPYAIYPGP
jgi:hypothetical protein